MRIPLRIGINKERNGVFLTNSIPFDRKRHLILQMNDVAKLIGAKANLEEMEYYPGRMDKSLLKLIDYKKKDKIIVFHPCSTRKEKEWNFENFIKLADIINENHKVKIILTGAENEKDRLNDIRTKAKKKNIYNLSGLTTLDDLWHLYSISRLVITIDTGPMHLAAANKNPRIIALFGYSDPNLTGILDKRRFVLSGFKRTGSIRKFFFNPNRSAVNSISPEHVYNLIAENKFI